MSRPLATLGVGKSIAEHAAFSLANETDATGITGDRSGRLEQFGPLQGANGFAGCVSTACGMLGA